jgi:hypothetical protein
VGDHHDEAQLAAALDGLGDGGLQLGLGAGLAGGWAKKEQGEGAEGGRRRSGHGRRLPGIHDHGGSGTKGRGGWTATANEAIRS